MQSGGDWFVERTTTVLPLCNYINAAGNYSLRSYSLSPEDQDGARHDLQGRDAGRALYGCVSAEISVQSLRWAACRPAMRPNTMQRVKPCWAKPPCDSPAQ